MTQDIEQVQTNSAVNGNGLDVQNVAMLGAALAGAGLETLEVRGLLASMQKLAMQTAMNNLAEVMDNINGVQRAKLISIVNQINMLPTKLGHVDKLQVLHIINSVLNNTPR